MKKNELIDKLKMVRYKVESDNFTKENLGSFIVKYMENNITEKNVIKKLTDIRDSIECDNYTWENIERLIEDIKKEGITE